MDNKDDTLYLSDEEILMRMPVWKRFLYRAAFWLIILHHGSLIGTSFLAQMAAAPIRFLISVPLYRSIESIFYQWGMINFDIASELTRRKWNWHIYGDPLTKEDESKNFLIVSNHTCTADWIFNMHYAALHNSASKLRFFMKRDHLQAPVIGWAAYLHDMIFLKRTDREYDLKVITEKLKDFQEHKTPNWLWLYPEGTFVSPYRTGTVERAHEYAKKRGWPQFNYVLNPRTTAFMLSLKGKNKESFDSVLDITIAFGPPHETKLGLTLQPQMVNCLRFERPTVDLHYHVRRFKISEIEDLQTDEGCEKWLHERFNEKEKLLEYFDKHGHFPGESRTPNRPFYFYIIFVMTFLALILFFYYMYKHHIYILACYLLFVVFASSFMAWYDGKQGLTTIPAKMKTQ